MSMYLKAVYKNGVFEPLEPVDLPENKEVDIVVEELRGKPYPGGKTAYDIFKDAGVIGCVEGGPADMSTNPKYTEGFGED